MSKEQVDEIFGVTDSAIFGFFKQYRFLSNFHEEKVEWDGLVYGSSEAAFQASKTLDPKLREPFTKYTPVKAKEKGRELPLRPDWDKGRHSVKDLIMHSILLAKFTQSEELRILLLETGDKYLEETNWWHDTYWGVCNGEGSNKLGRELMRVRWAIRQLYPNSLKHTQHEQKGQGTNGTES